MSGSGHVLMLRGINVGGRHKVPMADLRALLTDAGYGDVRTYVQSGNVVLSSALDPGALQDAAAALIEERFGFPVPVVVRSAEQLAAVVARDPLGEVADNPKLHQVTFLSDAPAPAAAQRLERLAAEGEAIAFQEREIHTWHPDGIARSKLATALGAPWLGVTATSRNWTTVGRLLEMAQGE